LEALINRNSQKRFKNRESQNLTMNEIAEKDFEYTEPQKRVRILWMKTKHFLHISCTRELFYLTILPNVISVAYSTFVLELYMAFLSSCGGIAQN
jgi:hypothetical protein